MIYIATMTMILLYYLVFIVYYQSLFPARGRKVFQVLLTLALIVASYVCLSVWDLLLLNFPSVMVIIIVGLRLCTAMNWKQAIYGGGTCAITAYCFRGGLTAFISLVYKGCDFLYDANAYYIVTLFALPASMLCLVVLRRTILPDNKVRQFMNNSGQLMLVIIYQLAAVINLVLINSGRYLKPNGSWYMGIALGACTLTLFMLIYAIYQSIRSTELCEYQWRTKVLEKQYERQLQHYKSYQTYTESFRAFRHDYKFMMASLKSLIRANDNEKAVQLLDNIYEDMQKKVRIHKKYSDNVTLDALLQDLANVCAAKEIRFDFKVSVPRIKNITLLDAIRIFSNITSNAVEACEKVPVSERFIRITGGNLRQWATLEVVNAYDGQVIAESGKILSTKPDRSSHGLGLRIVQELAEKMGGFVVIDADRENRTFLTRVHIPYEKDKAPPLL